MAKQAPAIAEKPGIVARVQMFYHDVLVEMKKVSWPTKEDVKASTQVVMFLLLILAGIVLIYDSIFGFVVVNLLKLLA